jgi:hypothetical protein
MIDSTVTTVAGVDRVDLSVGGDVVRHDTPPEGNPTTFRVSQLWTPAEEGRATITVVAYDVNEVSGRATITLQVVATGGAVPTAEVGSPTEPGSTEVPEPTETPPPPVTTEAGCTLNSQYVADVTIPDGTVMSPGAGFVKTWRVRNSGTCDWEAGFQLVFVSGAQMGGPGSVTLPAVAAGAETDVSVNLVAPSAYGVHKGTWRVRSTDGTVFGTNLTVVVEVPAPATDTPTPPTAPTAPPTDTPTPGSTLVPINPPKVTLTASPYTEKVLEEAAVAGGGYGSLMVYCPAGGVAVGGGFSVGPDVLFLTQYMFGNGWRVDVKNTAGSSEIVRAYAVCLHNAAGAHTTQMHKKVTLWGHDHQEVLVSCSPGSIVTGGGWSAGENVRIYTSNKAGGDTWRVSGHNIASVDETLTAFAICLSGVSGITTQFGTATTLPSSGAGSVATSCPAGSIMTGGGFVDESGGDLLIHINSGPWGTGKEWRVYALDTNSSAVTLHGYATCLGFP